MKAATRKLRPPIKKHGGKNYLAARIIARMPPHRVYCEPFIGGGSVLLNKPRVDREVAGDLDAGLVNLWQILAARPELITGALARVPYEEASFRAALSESARHNAVSYLVRNRFSRGGLGETFAWSERLRGGQPGDANAWDTIRAELPAIAARVKDVEFRCVDALQLIREVDSSTTLHYCDPPYYHTTRTVRDAYEFELTDAQHVDLLRTLCGCEGAVMLSGYPSELYAAALPAWTLETFDLPNHSSQAKTKARRTECLWSKGPGPVAMGAVAQQANLFGMG